MGISLKPQHLKRYKDIAWLLMKYGRSDLIKNAGLDSVLKEEDPAAPFVEAPPEAKALADDLEKMGPTFIKLGQLLSTRPDLLPISYLEALTRLQDRVEPFPYEEVEAIVSSELGVRMSKAFSEFDPAPIAAASLGQVHRARMRDGRPIAVKVQRPNIREQVVEDLEALGDVAEFLDSHTGLGKHYEFQKMLEEFRRSLMRELDYRQEAANLATMNDILKEFDGIVVPLPIDDYTTSRVLTMDYIKGKKITSLTTLARMEVDGTRLAEQLFRAYLKQILVDGFFHADPHPGNVFLTDDGRIAMLDLGMVARITPALQEKLLQLLLAVAEGRSEDAANFAIRIGERTEDFDEAAFRRRVADIVAQQQGRSAEQLEIGKVMLEVTQVSGECAIRVPPELTMLGKTLLNLDQVGWTLDPDFDPNAAIRRNAVEIMQQRMAKSVSPASIFSSLMDMKDFLETMPRRINKILDRVANNDIEVKVDAIDEKRLMEGLQKIANRITMGLVLAALIIGAAMLMSVPTDFRILGYPGLAMIFFLIATGGGLILMINILFYDEKAKKKS
ncbi:MAG TPA: AarF/UbiB family protein [Blastocatellia bacterium]|jgi:predicted unusual protein kinase regulating ubiquinone biosynthesis (AarF/ABC1/UbiB family)|nr:AarF/UbiB family protein [Blastocatellia bacterium]